MNARKKRTAYSEIEGIRFYGKVKGFLSAKEIEQATVSPKSILHVIRHLAGVAPDARDKLLGLTVVDGGKERRVNNSFIATQLESIGSKFNAKINNPFRLLEACRTIIAKQVEKGEEIPWIYNAKTNEAIAKAKVNLSDEYKRELGLASTDFVGTSNVVPITKDIRDRIIKKRRGKGEAKDHIKVNVVKGIDPPLTDNIIIALRKHGNDKPEFYTAYTGILTASIPRQDEQSKEEFQYNTKWWRNYAFIEVS